MKYVQLTMSSEKINSYFLSVLIFKVYLIIFKVYLIIFKV